MNQELDNETKIYRFVSFLELYEILNSRKLRFQKLASMEDPNEGLGYILSIQQDEIFGFQVGDNDKIDKYLNSHKNNNFISSWTIESDLIALWSLYSKDNTSVRIETSAVKLRDICNNYKNSNYYNRGFSLDPNDKRHVCRSALVEKVIYEDFYMLHESLKKYWEEINKHVFDNHKKHLNYSNKVKITNPDHSTKKIIDYEKAWRLKDISYKHENEVRANLSLAIRDHLPLDSKERHAGLLGVLKYAPPDFFGDSVFLNTPENFIESVCFDPRCPEYKKNQMISIVRDRFDIKITTSKAFGYALNKHDFSIMDI